MRDFLRRLNDSFARFMYGRYGYDQLGKFLIILSFAALIVSWFITPYARYAFWALIVLFYFRAFSKNINKRFNENQRYIALSSKITYSFRNKKDLLKQYKNYHIYKCPACGQKIRIPRGKGRIMVTCPRCRSQFEKRS